MRRLLAVAAAALAVPAAAHAKEINGLAVCGPERCERIDLAGFGHQDPIADVAAARDAPPPSAFLRIDFTVDGHEGAFTVFYEPESGLVAVEPRPGPIEWARLAPPIAREVKEAARGLAPFPAPSVTAVKIGARTVTKDVASYLELLTVEGPHALPQTTRDAEGIRFESVHPNPWTGALLLYYREDDVLFRNGTYVKLPGPLAARVEGRGGTLVPWLPFAVALGGLALVVATSRRRRGSTEEITGVAAARTARPLSR